MKRASYSGLVGLAVLAIALVPGIANADDASLDGRKQLFIERVAANGYPTSYDGGRAHGGYAAMAQFALGEVGTARDWVNLHIVRNKDMFWGMNVMESYMKYKDDYTAAMRTDVKSKILTFNILNAAGTALSGSTENHRLMYAAVGIVAGEQWPAEYDADYSREAKEYILSELPKIVRRGFIEYDADTYFAHHVGPLVFLAEYADDEQIKTMARMTAEWYFASIVGEYLQGSIVTSQGRTGQPMQGGGWNNGEGIQLLWMLFGGSPVPVLHTGGTSQFARPTVGWGHMPLAVGDYKLPDIFKRIALDRRATYTHKERTDRHPTNPYKTSYVAPDYSVFSQRDSRAGERWQEQGQRWGVKWVAEADADEPGAFFMKHHFSHPAEGTAPALDYTDPTVKEYWLGAETQEEVLQDNGTLISVYNITDGHEWIDGPVSLNGITHTIERDGWIFFHTGKMMMAVRPINGYSWPTGTGEWFYGDYVKALRSDGAKNGLIVDTVPATNYDGTGATQLDSFANDILANTTVTPNMTATNPSLEYTNLAGRKLELVWNTRREINDVPVNYTGWPLLDNPWMHQDFDSGVLYLSHGHENMYYDFNNWKVGHNVFGDTNSYIEAELYTRKNGQFDEVVDVGRFNEQYMVIPNGQGNGRDDINLEYDLKVTNGGQFYVWLLSNGVNDDDNSFRLQVDSAAPADILLHNTNTWQWRRATATVALSNGSHVLRLLDREDGTKVDRILLTKSATFDPSDPINQARNATLSVDSTGGVNATIRATDGIVNSNDSRWVSAGSATQHWIELSWPTPKAISQVRVWSGNMSQAGWQIPAFRMQRWNGTAWVDIPGTTVTGNTQDGFNGAFNDLTFSPVTTTRIRMYITDGSSQPGSDDARLLELEAWGR